jgi:hypothetical protein
MSTAVRRGRALATLIGTAGIVVWASDTALIKLAGPLPPIEMVALAFAAGAIASAVFGAATGRLNAAIFRQPLRAWLLIVPSLVGYHACIYSRCSGRPLGLRRSYRAARRSSSCSGPQSFQASTCAGGIGPAPFAASSAPWRLSAGGVAKTLAPATVFFRWC